MVTSCITRIAATDPRRATAATVPAPGDLSGLLAAADRHPDTPLGTADDLCGRELRVLAELLLRGVHADRLGLGLDLGDLLDLPLLQRLAQPRLRPLAGLHHELRRVGATLDHVRVGGQGQVRGHHQDPSAAGDVSSAPRTEPTMRLSSAITMATACCPALSRAAAVAGGAGSELDGTVNCRLMVVSRYGRAAISASLGP